MAISGLVKEELIFRNMEHPDEKTLAWLPNVRMMFKSRPDRDAQFDLVVRSLIDGLHTRLLLNRSVPDRAQRVTVLRTSPRKLSKKSKA